MKTGKTWSYTQLSSSSGSAFRPYARHSCRRLSPHYIRESVSASRQLDLLISRIPDFEDQMKQYVEVCVVAADAPAASQAELCFDAPAALTLGHANACRDRLSKLSKLHVLQSSKMVFVHAYFAITAAVCPAFPDTCLGRRRLSHMGPAFSPTMPQVISLPRACFQAESVPCGLFTYKPVQ